VANALYSGRHDDEVQLCAFDILADRDCQFVIDGEAVILGVDGISDFNALHSGRHNEEAQLCAFDVLAMDGDDLRRLPLSMRKANLARLLARRPEGIFLSPFEQGEIGPDCLRVRARGPCLEASRPALSRRQVKALD
jgi:ATP-dependent DNA ligase